MSEPDNKKFNHQEIVILFSKIVVRIINYLLFLAFLGFIGIIIYGFTCFLTEPPVESRSRKPKPPIPLRSSYIMPNETQIKLS